MTFERYPNSSPKSQNFEMVTDCLENLKLLSVTSDSFSNINKSSEIEGYVELNPFPKKNNKRNENIT